MLFPLLSGLLIMLSTAHAQDMDFMQPQKHSIPSDITRMLVEDDTDKQGYIMAKFTCNEYAIRLYLQRSNRVLSEGIDYEGFEIDSGVGFQTLEAKERFPLFYVSLAQREAGFYHAINAVLMNDARPDLISSYIFIEPQNDIVMKTPEELYRKYKKFYSDRSEPLEINISDVTKFAHNGYIYQSFTETLAKFVQYPESSKTND